MNYTGRSRYIITRAIFGDSGNGRLSAANVGEVKTRRTPRGTRVTFFQFHGNSKGDATVVASFE